MWNMERKGNIYRTEKNRTEMLFMKTCTYIHRHTNHAT